MLGSIVGMPEASQQQQQRQPRVRRQHRRWPGRPEGVQPRASRRQRSNLSTPTCTTTKTTKQQRKMLHTRPRPRSISCATQVPKAPQCAKCLSSRPQRTDSWHSCVGTCVRLPACYCIKAWHDCVAPCVELPRSDKTDDPHSCAKPRKSMQTDTKHSACLCHSSSST